jgi:hypothetical protein
MEDSKIGKVTMSPFPPKKCFSRWKEKPLRSKAYLEFLSHYDAELRQTDGPITIVRRKTGIELPLEQKGKLQMVRLLLDEFGTIDQSNKAIGDYGTTHS